MLENEQVYVDELFWSMTRSVKSGSANVLFYPYRKAQPNHILMKLPRNREFELLLASKADIVTQSEEYKRCFENRKPQDRIDNHTLYQITMKDGNKFCVWCHDTFMYIGLGVNEGNW